MPETLGERLKAWRLLAEGLKSRLGEVEFLTADHTELAALVQQIGAVLRSRMLAMSVVLIQT